MSRLLFIATHWLSWVSFISIVSIVFSTLYKDINRVNDIKVYIFLAEIWVFWYLPRAVVHEPKGEWVAFLLVLIGAVITMRLLYSSVFNDWRI